MSFCAGSETVQVKLISGNTLLAHAAGMECLKWRCSTAVKSLMESSATCLASISSLLSEAQDEALYIFVILPLLLITLHDAFQRLQPTLPHVALLIC